MKVKEIIEATDGKLICGNIENECGDFCRDTRIIKNGDKKWSKNSYFARSRC